MVKYTIRSRQIIDIMNEIKSGRLILSPYFQRDFVWRNTHKMAFITTILEGLPFPQIFIAKGDIDINTMTVTSCVVDGQQRLNTIKQFIDGDLKVNGRLYDDLSDDEKSDMLKYEVPIIDLDISYKDKMVKDIFKNLNMTFYSLSTIEKLSTEYGHSEIMLFAKFLVGNISFEKGKEAAPYEYDPQIPPDFIKWAKNKSRKNTSVLLSDTRIFSTYEISRKVNLMFALNILGTMMTGFFNRNVTSDFLDSNSEELPDKNILLEYLEKVTGFVLALKLPASSYWFNKANMFSLIIWAFQNIHSIKKLNQKKTVTIAKALQKFERKVPAEYSLAAKEAVNNKSERMIRNDHLTRILSPLL